MTSLSSISGEVAKAESPESLELEDLGVWDPHPVHQLQLHRHPVVGGLLQGAEVLPDLGQVHLGHVGLTEDDSRTSLEGFYHDFVRNTKRLSKILTKF